MLRSAAAIAVVVAMGSCSSPPPPHESRTYDVEIHGMVFVPASLPVHRGDVVTWTNHDLVPHTVTAAGWFDSGSLAPGARWSYVVEQPVTIDYGCTFHPTMKARLLAQ
jgi:plastocyanin